MHTARDLAEIRHVQETTLQERHPFITALDAKTRKEVIDAIREATAHGFRKGIVHATARHTHAAARLAAKSPRAAQGKGSTIGTKVRRRPDR